MSAATALGYFSSGWWPACRSPFSSENQFTEAKMATWSDKPIVKMLEIPSRWIPGATMADALLAAESPDLSEADRMTRITQGHHRHHRRARPGQATARGRFRPARLGRGGNQRRGNRAMNAPLTQTQADALNLAILAVQRYAAMHPRPSSVVQKDAAQMLGISGATFSRLVRSGRVTLNAVGRVPITEVDRLLAAPRLTPG
ncbi:hypothetical protein [Propionivibrio sp.]|uniref:hypothetical protein n=3 Tax=Propionivibrio sp. TaxID=2212460 RepID=UPI0025D45BA4|nr:hypothetical protein [Propionivibrio sp.]